MRANSVRGVIFFKGPKEPGKDLNSVRGPIKANFRENEEIIVPKAPEIIFLAFFIENLPWGKRANSVGGLIVSEVWADPAFMKIVFPPDTIHNAPLTYHSTSKY